MKFRTIVITLMTSIFLAIFCKAQEEISFQPPSVFGPSPNVAQMTRFLDQAVDYSTGIPDIKIPLYFIEEGDITIPITLDYYAGGIKVSQEASSVGLGWSLSAGGVLSREIRGIIDDFNSNDPGNTVDGVIYADISLVQMAAGQGEIESVTYQQFRENDLEADLFNIVFPAEGGSQFVYNQSIGEFVELENKNNKIDYFTEFQDDRPKRIYSWEVTSPAGIKYFFGEKSDSINFSNPKYSEKNNREIIYNNSIPSMVYDDPEGIVSWYLNQIKDTRGNYVKFYYGNNAQVKYYNKLPFKGSVNVIDPNNPLSSQTTIGEKVIKEINFSLGKIKFYYSDNYREDLENSKYLEEIKIFNTNNQLIKSIEFEYSYFNHKASNKAPYIGDKNYYEKRLKLDAINIKDKKSETSELYQFEYDSTLLPSKFSYAQDYWGGYNGKIENNWMIPATTFYRKGESTNDWNYVEILEMTGAERNVEKEFVTAGILKKIIYPTGGFTIYEYEPNTISDYVHLESYYQLDERMFVKNIKNPYIEKELEFFSGSSVTNGDCERIDVGSDLVYFSCPFTLEKPLQSPLPFIDYNSGFFHCPEGSITINDDPLEGVPAEGDIVCKFFPVYYKRKNDPIDSKLMDGDWMFLDPENEEDKNLELVVKFNGSKDILNYNDGNPEDKANFSIYEIYKEDIDPINRYVGGLRVKSIENYDSNGVRKSLKEFQYEFDGESSGKAMLPQFALYENLKYYPNINYGMPYLPYTFLISDTNINPFFYNKVAYGKVRETVKEINQISGDILNEKMHSLYEFNNSTFRFADVSFRDPNFIVRHYKLLDISWNNKKNGEYSYNDDNELISENVYASHFADTFTNDNVFFSGFRIVDFSHTLNDGGYLNASLVFDYNNIFSYSIPTSQSSITYFNNSQIENIISYEYNGINPLLPSSKESINSQEEIIRTEYKYPEDLISQLGMSSLVDANRIAEPIEIKAFVDGVKTSEKKTKYDEFNNGSLIMPSEVYVKKGAGSITNEDRKIIYNSYDSRGNLREYTLENGTPVCIIWGYDGQYPVAKVEGMHWNEIASLASSLESNYNLTVASFDALRTLVDSHNNHAMLTCYIYEPLVGVTTIIQPNGQMETYDYDDAGRLKEVRDHEGNLIKEMEYHYKN